MAWRGARCGAGLPRVVAQWCRQGGGAAQLASILACQSPSAWSRRWKPGGLHALLARSGKCTQAGRRHPPSNALAASSRKSTSTGRLNECQQGLTRVHGQGAVGRRGTPEATPDAREAAAAGLALQGAGGRRDRLPAAGACPALRTVQPDALWQHCLRHGSIQCR